jgi:uracil permease
MQGVALIVAEKVDLYDPRQLAIGAVILVVGIGGHIGFGGNLPIEVLTGIFPQRPAGHPDRRGVLGILLNLIFRIFPVNATSGVGRGVKGREAGGREARGKRKRL